LLFDLVKVGVYSIEDFAEMDLGRVMQHHRGSWVVVVVREG
jgi:hypothetical protein